ncbi:hypothetical protein [Methanobrevibacter sp.]|uniref:hypothetical protein n=1 Tax=Methanobrevibacter sp. TaxID=66852 RepID=UPI003863D096
MTTKNHNTKTCIKHLNKVIDALNEKDRTINEWKSIKTGCDSPYNMKNHIDKLNRDLEEWKTLMPGYHTPKLAAKKITKLETELKDWQSAVPNCETPTKLKTWAKKYSSEEDKPKNTTNMDNFETYLTFINMTIDLEIPISEFSIEDFNKEKMTILKYIDDTETPDDRIKIIDTYKIIDFLIYEFDNQIPDPQVSIDKLADINRRFR